MNQDKPLKIINIRIREKKLMEIKKRCDQKTITAYIRDLLYEGMQYAEKEDMYIYLNEHNNFYKTEGKKYFTIRVSENTYNKIRELSNASGVSLPRISGHFIERGLEREMKKE